jgi:hypothetical protein
MRLFHQRSFPRSAPLCKSDEEECFTSVGRRKGVYLTTETPGGSDVLTLDAAESAITEYEVTRPGEPARSFVVPFGVLKTLDATGR